MKSHLLRYCQNLVLETMIAGIESLSSRSSSFMRNFDGTDTGMIRSLPRERSLGNVAGSALRIFRRPLCRIGLRHRSHLDMSYDSYIQYGSLSRNHSDVNRTNLLQSHFFSPDITVPSHADGAAARQANSPC